MSQTQTDAPVIIVTGCGDCKFHSYYGVFERNHCGLSGTTEISPEDPIFNTCPLKKSQTTIKLEQ